MQSILSSSLFIDIQALAPVGYCPVCGGELYGPQGRCFRCEEEGEA